MVLRRTPSPRKRPEMAVYSRLSIHLPGKSPRLEPEKPRPEDRVPAGLCRRCGLIGGHSGWRACIDALRSELAEIQFKLARARRGRCGGRTSGPGKCRPRSGASARASERKPS